MVTSVRYPTFDAYISAVDNFLRRMTGKESSDFPDHNFHADYESDVKPMESALVVVYKLRVTTHTHRPRRIA